MVSILLNLSGGADNGKKDIASYSFEELQEEMLAIGEKGFRSRQIYSWIHEKLVDDFEEMTNLPKTLRQKLEAAYEIRRVEMEKDRFQRLTGPINSCFV